MIQVITFVLQLATAFLSVGANSSLNNGGSRHLQNLESKTVIGSVKLTGSSNGVCQASEQKNGCDSNLVLQAELYDDESVAGCVDCMKFLFVDEDKYAVVGGVITKGDKIDDIFELNAPVVGSRFAGVAKEDSDGVVFYSGDFFTSRTCDDIDKTIVQILPTYTENIDGQATIVFPSAPVNCGDVEGKKECRKSKECEWDINEGTCVSKGGGLGIPSPVVAAESLSKEEAPIEGMVNGSTSADPKMIMLGMGAGLFYALWL